MSARLTGLSAWVVQRLSAVYMALFSLAAVAIGLAAPPHGYAEWRALVGRPAVATALALFFVALLLHAWVGARDIVLDYAGRRGWRLFLLALLAAWLLALAVWMARIILGVTS